MADAFVTVTLAVRSMSGWYVKVEGTGPLGPLPTEQVTRGVASGDLRQDALVCRVGGDTWHPLRSFPEFGDPNVPPPPPDSNVAVTGPDEDAAELMRAAPGRLVAKVGAEGVHKSGILPCEEWPKGFGVALKIEDGDDKRARPTVVIETLRQLRVLRDESLEAVSRYAFFPVKNRPACDTILASSGIPLWKSREERR